MTVWLLSASAYGQSRVVAYVPNWGDLNAFSATIDYAKLTHINIAFENPVNAEGELSFHQKNLALIARAQTNGVKVMVSIGGGSASGNKNAAQPFRSRQQRQARRLCRR